METKMKAKNVLVSFMTVACILLLASTLSAAELADEIVVKVDGMNIASFTQGGGLVILSVPSVIAGETLDVEVYFNALEDDTAVTLEVELEGDKVDVDASSEFFDVETGHRYDQAVSLKVPFELKDQVSDFVYLTIEIDGKDHNTELDELEMRVQRPSYFPEIKSITFDQTVDAGETFPVDIVLKNMGYNDLDDLYVTISIPELGLSKGPTWFGDLVPIEFCDDDCESEDTVSGRLYLELPYEASEGMYTLKVEVYNDDVRLSESRSLSIENAFSNSVIISSYSKHALVDEEVEYTMLIVNPTNQLKVFRVVTESGSGFSASVSEAVIAIPAGSSETVRILATANEAGDYTFNANVFEGESLISTTSFSLNAEGADKKSFAADPIVILTIILAIVFLVLLVVLIVLIGKKPSKTEEFGESYY